MSQIKVESSSSYKIESRYTNTHKIFWTHRILIKSLPSGKLLIHDPGFSLGSLCNETQKRSFFNYLKCSPYWQSYFIDECHGVPASNQELSHQVAPIGLPASSALSVTSMAILVTYASGNN